MNMWEIWNEWTAAELIEGRKKDDRDHMPGNPGLLQ